MLSFSVALCRFVLSKLQQISTHHLLRLLLEPNSSQYKSRFDVWVVFVMKSFWLKFHPPFVPNLNFVFFNWIMIFLNMLIITNFFKLINDYLSQDYLLSPMIIAFIHRKMDKKSKNKIDSGIENHKKLLGINLLMTLIINEAIKNK